MKNRTATSPAGSSRGSKPGRRRLRGALTRPAAGGPPQSHGRSSEPAKRPGYSRWRAACLIGVHVLIGLHIAHWKITGRTLAPLELNEVMHTFELGIITAGFLFMVTAVLATAIFGRFFCSWGCHILALQDGSAWILRKLRIKPVAIRSRVLMLVPLGAALYMFVWPQVVRIWHGLPAPQLRIATDADGWASFTTENFWRNLPGLWVTAATFLVVGFLVIYVLGSRSFCRYGCPYGAIFGLADRIAPGRIRLTKECAQCGTCTAVCQSHIRVHEELNRYGMVVNPACLKDLDCVSACPNEAVRFGFGLPSLAASARNNAKVKTRYDLSWGEEVLAACVFLLTLVVYRGLYELIPLLMALALAAMAAYLSVVCSRLVFREHVAFNRWPIKRGGSLTPSGALVAVLAVCLATLTLHSGFVRYHEYRGLTMAAALRSGPASDHRGDTGIAHLETALAWGLRPTDRSERALVELYQRQGSWIEAERLLRRRLAANRAGVWTLERLAGALAGQSRWLEAIDMGRKALTVHPAPSDLHYRIAGWCFQAGRLQEAVEHLNQAVSLQPDFAEAQLELGALQIRMGDTEGGVAALRQAVALRPDHADAHYNLAVGLSMMGRYDEAADHAATAAALAPDDPQSAALHEVLGDRRPDPEQPVDRAPNGPPNAWPPVAIHP